ncbi:serine/threonine protein kinase [Saccharopolyspora sp. WRP15-2]|uniref:Serine/threonine protein kinase n=1 Tax=Saccharopolyspora oryzae TaxID=2997343 RepID=A0ABT4UYR0_9PSEU|nr:serine/threonine protein kinase [Saccharopolyspora oryzae]MDA3626845.1 serine/threonine protein kinase [Saccharopolyspora oryzae]
MRTPRGVRISRLSAIGVAALIALAPVPPAAAEPQRDVMFVGNNWDGTVDLVDAEHFGKYQRIDVVPDLQQRLAEMTPDEHAAMAVIRNTAGEGHDQLVDDIAVSPDGRTMYVSRPSLGDVAAYEIDSGRQVWRTDVSGYRSDHMALSPDGSQLAVSATTANQVELLDPATGTVVGNFPTGDFPHENRYSADGRTLYNATIGRVIMPDDPALDPLKGNRWLTIVDTATNQVTDTIDFGVGIRPFLVMPDGRTMYAQLSFHHGFVEYDLVEKRITRTVHLPLSEDAKKLRRDEYPLDSAHHGLALNGDGTKLCDAGTVSDYAAIVSVPSLTTDALIPTGKKPYWAAATPNGQYCVLSNSDSDDITVVDFDRSTEVARIPVGDHPQRVRGYAVPTDVLAG